MINSLKLAKQLQESGFSVDQAETLTNVLQEVQDESLENLAAKLETLATKKDLKYEFEKLRHEMDNKFSAVENNFATLRGENALIKWMIGVMLAGVVSLVLKAFFI